MTARLRTTKLLVSVRSAEEARAAVAGGASVIDVKEPNRGPLGRASAEIWRAVRAVVPANRSVSVALGELGEWDRSRTCRSEELEGIAYRKLGLAGAGPDWIARWAEVRRNEPGETHWVAVAYADWQSARAPDPDAVLQAASEAGDCQGILVDTFDKTKPSSLSLTPDWIDWVSLAQRLGLFVALAGGLDLAAIVRLAPLQPDLFAVRGAACDQSDRQGTVNADRVAQLVETIRQTCPTNDDPM